MIEFKREKLGKLESRLLFQDSVLISMLAVIVNGPAWFTITALILCVLTSTMSLFNFNFVIKFNPNGKE